MGRCSKTAVYVRGHCDKKVALYREKHWIKVLGRMDAFGISGVDIQ